MINIRSILKLAENDGMTLKNGNKIIYKSGWQVATEGVECKTAREAINAVKAYNGNCRAWPEFRHAQPGAASLLCRPGIPENR